MNLADLRKPFPPDRISWRVGSTTKDKTKGMALAYIDARDVQDRLDEICGVEGWQCRYVPMHDKKTVCEIGISIYRQQNGNTLGPPQPGFSEWIWKSDGAGDSDIEAEKGALSDAFKRAAVRWGVGRYLYDIESPWVELEPAGNSYKIAAKEYKRLEALLAGTKPPAMSRDEKGAALDKARNWAKEAIREIHSMSGDALEMWPNKNAAALVKLRAIDPDTHRQILDAIQGK